MNGSHAIAAITKSAAVILATVAAAAVVYIQGGPWSRELYIGAAAFAIPFVLARVAPAAGVALVAACAYVLPAGLGILTGPTHPLVHAMWMVMVIGLVAGSGRLTRWHLPGSWACLAAAWALVVLVSGFIAMGREADFVPWLTFGINVPNTGIGGPPELVVAWLGSVAAGTAAGLLWIDWLFQRYSTTADPHVFGREVAAPFVVGALASTAIALAQGALDPGFLNTGFYAYLQRSSGGMLDANAYGVAMSLWVGAMLGASAEAGISRTRRVLFAGVAGALMLGAWLSASRGALLILACALVGVLGQLATKLRRSDASIRRRALVVVTVSALLLAIAATQIQGGPLRRLTESLPEGPIPIARELWNRGGFGPAALLMIREFPLAGVGVGAFHFLLNEFSMRATGIYIHSDNAQNWYRHQLAELGALGSLPWIVWLTLLIGFVVRRWRAVLQSSLTAGLAAALGGFALASLVGMPGQNHAVAVTVWTLLFWLIKELTSPAKAGRHEDGPAEAGRHVRWALVLVLVAVHAGLTWRDAVGELRVPHRAARGGWRYAYGVYPVETAADGREFRWTGRRALVVVDAPERWMRLMIGAGPPDLASSPADVQLWCDGVEVVNGPMASAEPLTKYLLLPEGRRRVVIESRTSRVWNPSTTGSADNRDLGLSLSWTFESRPADELAGSAVRIR